MEILFQKGYSGNYQKQRHNVSSVYKKHLDHLNLELGEIVLLIKRLGFRKQVNDYKLKLEKNDEFLYLELTRNGFHTVSSRPLTLHPQLRGKVDDKLKLQDILQV